MKSYEQILSDPVVVAQYKKIDSINKHPFNHGLQHVKNVCEIMAKLCDALGITDKKKESLLVASALHDIGQVNGRNDHGLYSRIFIENNYGDEIGDSDYYESILNAVENHNQKHNLDALPIFTNLLSFADKMDFTKSRLEPDYDERFGNIVYSHVTDVNFFYYNGTFTVQIKTDGTISDAELLDEEKFFYKVINATRMLAKRLNAGARMLVDNKELEINFFEHLGSNSKKFLESLGIHSDLDMPNSFLRPIKSVRKELTSSERFYCGTPSASGSYFIPFSIKDLVGTDHERYAGRSWIAAFSDLDRGEQNLEHYFANPDYYDVGLKEGKELEHTSGIGVAKKNGKYYVHAEAGGGNNRMILMKIKYLALAEGKTEEELKELDEQFQFYANTRILPDNPEIPNLVDKVIYSHYDQQYSFLNISNDPNVRLYNVMHGPYGNKEYVCGPLTEEELVVYANDLLESFKKDSTSFVPK